MFKKSRAQMPVYFNGGINYLFGELIQLVTRHDERE